MLAGNFDEFSEKLLHVTLEIYVFQVTSNF